MTRTTRTRMGAYGVAVGVTAVAVGVRLLLDPLLGDHVPFATFFAAVAVAAWVGGLRPALAATALGLVAATYLFVPPRHTFVGVSGPHLVGLGTYLVTGLVIAGIGEAVLRATLRLAEQGERLRTTLASIGDAVITTDTQGRVTGMNAVAESLTRWTTAEAVGQPLDAVFHIVNETTRKTVESPATKALREGVIVGLANHTVLIGKDGTERPIDDSAAPIRREGDAVVGCVLVFRDVTERRAAELALAERLRIVALRADVSTAVATAQPLRNGLQGCCEAVVKHLGGAFARVWTHDEAAGVLELQASAGRYTHLDGPHSRIKVGEYKIGRIASSRQPHLTNDVPRDPNVSDPAWAEREGMVAFAGYPLEVEGRLVGVLAMFARQPLTEATLSDLASVAGMVAQHVARKRADEGVREAHSRLESTLAAGAVGTWEFDVVRNVVRADANLARMFGVTPDDAAGGALDAYLRVIHPDDVGRVSAAIGRALEAGDGYEAEYRLVGPAGAVRWVEARGRVERDEGGRAVRFPGVVADISDRKRADEERQLLVSVVQNSPDFIGCSDAEGNPLFVNRAGRELVGLAPDHDVRRTRIADYFVPEQRGFVNEVVVPAILSEGRWVGELTFRHFETGAAIPVLYDLFRVDDTATGRPLNFAAVTRDLTERKRAEAAREGTQQTLAALVERCPFGIYIVDSDFRIARVNAGSENGAFVNVRPVVGRPFDEAMRIIWPEPVATELIGTFRHTLATGEPYYSKDFVSPRADTDATEGYEWELHRLTLPDGRPGVVCYYFDATKLRYAERELRLVAARLSEADRQKNVFLATLAHELRNPLAPIRNGLQILKLSGSTTAAEKSLHMMGRQVEQMTQLIDDLMDLSRISQDKIVLKKTRLRLADPVQNAVDTSRPLMEAKGHAFTLDMPPDPIYVDGDNTRLSQVFTNLLNNAAKYTDAGGRIRLSVQRDGDGVAVAVEDNGVGIPAPMLPKVFDIFTQVDRSLEKSQGGLGIGLSIVKRLVEMHDGDIGVESGGQDRGSRFTVRLPSVLTAAPSQPDGADAPHKPIAARRILVVDDNVDGAGSLADMLNLMGNETQTAHDGLEAVAASEAFRPDVILMDIGMPKLNGYEACRRIREKAWGEAIIIVAQTGWGQDDDRQRSQAAGFNFHMVKPVDPVALVKLLAGLTEASKG